MRLSACTAFFGHRQNGTYWTYVESIRRCKAAGFDVVDANFCNALRGKTDLIRDDWEKVLHELRDEAEKTGVVFSQSHPVFIPGDPAEQPPEKMELYREMMRRSIIGSGILGVQWAVIHPIEEKTKAVFDTEASIARNMEFFSPIHELAGKHNVGLAYENMLERPATKRRFSSNAAELAALVDAYRDPRVGACWDFGHGNLLYKDQRFALRTLGKRLKATHVDDNNGAEDDHMFPFHGTVDWAALMPVLVEIGYEGDFAYETHKEIDRMPDHLKDEFARMARAIGTYLLSLAAPAPSP